MFELANLTLVLSLKIVFILENHAYLKNTTLWICYARQSILYSLSCAKLCFKIHIPVQSDDSM